MTTLLPGKTGSHFCLDPCLNLAFYVCKFSYGSNLQKDKQNISYSSIHLAGIPLACLACQSLEVP